MFCCVFNFWVPCALPLDVDIFLLRAMFIRALVLLSIIALVAHACTSNDMQFTGKSALLTPIPEPKTSKIQRSIGGTVEVLDGCRFRVKNMTLIPSALNTYWYAIPVNTLQPNIMGEQPPYIDRITTNGALGNYNGQMLTFTLNQDMEFNKTAIIMIYSESDFRPFAAFGVTKRVKEYFNNSTDTSSLKLDEILDNSGDTIDIGVSGWFSLLVLFISIYI